MTTPADMEQDRLKAISLVGELFAVLDKDKWQLAEAMVREALAEARKAGEAAGRKAERKAVLDIISQRGLWTQDELRSLLSKENKVNND